MRPQEEINLDKANELLAVKEWIKQHVESRTSRDLLCRTINKELHRLGYTWDVYINPIKHKLEI